MSFGCFKGFFSGELEDWSEYISERILVIDTGVQGELGVVGERREREWVVGGGKCGRGGKRRG